MTMTKEQRDALVDRLESEADRNPALYRLKLGALAASAYVYTFGVPALLIGGAAGLGHALAALAGGPGLVRIAIPAAAVVGLAFAASRTRLDPPAGFEMKPTERRRLFATIEDVRLAVGAPPVHAVLLTKALDAAVVQVPRLGVFGWRRSYLTLGLPLMQLSTLDELKAVLAHELGHLSKAHGRFGAWIYRVRATWTRLDERMQRERHWSRFLFAPFFGWFAPLFAAYAFVQARQQEYDADAIAADTAGATSLASALIRLDLKGRELRQHFWPAVCARAADEPSPSAAPFSRLATREHRGFSGEAPEHLKQALTRPTDTSDTHPCLNERIAAIRQPARMPPAVTESAAEALFGGALKFIAEHLDDEWRREIAPWWTERHAKLRSGRERLAGFKGKTPEQMSDEELQAFARLTEEVEGQDRAYPHYLLLARRPSRPLVARFAVGRLLLASGDERGRQVIDRIIAENPEAVVPACDIVIRYLRSMGREREAKPYLDRYWQKRNADAETARRSEVRPTGTG